MNINAQYIEEKERELFYERVREALTQYENAFEVKTFILDSELCIRKNGGGIHTEPCERCASFHSEALTNAQLSGGIHIYRCPSEALFWISPIFNAGKLAGGLIGTAPAATEARRIELLAEMLLLIAENLSQGSPAFYKALRRRRTLSIEIGRGIETMKNLKLSRDPIYFSMDCLEKETQLLNAICKGDAEKARIVLRELLAELRVVNEKDFESERKRAMELVILVSRAGIVPGFNAPYLLESTDYFLDRLNDAHSEEELASTICAAMEHALEQILPFRNLPHAGSIRKAERFIRENFTRKISLEDAAKVAGLSIPYFSTIFKQEMGENFSSFINRLRVEKAISMLRKSTSPLVDIAAACGFEDQSWFSKIFKQYTGLSPGKFRDSQRCAGAAASIPAAAPHVSQENLESSAIK
jgi:AraC-like DNA-binding protein